MAHMHQNNKKLLTRIRRIKGQSESLERGIVSGAECAAVLQQVAGSRGGVNGLMTEMLEGHIREHLGPVDVTPEARSKDVEQVVAVLRSYLK